MTAPDALPTMATMPHNTSQLTCWQTMGETNFLTFNFLSKSIVLTTIDLMVICGNALVIMSVFLHRSLHTTTNYLITSLAFSDFMLGLFVIPFSISQEIFISVWPFGPVWCEVYMAADVWLCTASIYNLVAISFDRYMAVTRPINYKLISSRRMGKYLVALAWIVSFLICAPPLLVTFMSDTTDAPPPHVIVHAHDAAHTRNTSTLTHLLDTLAALTDDDRPQPIGIELVHRNATPVESTCSCTPMMNSDAYIIYSSLGSFVLPLIAIIVLNWGIFKHARLAGKMVLRRDVSVHSPGNDVKCGKPAMAEMRIHRGGQHSSAASAHIAANPLSSRRKSTQAMMINSGRRVSTVSNTTTKSVYLPPLTGHAASTYCDVIESDDADDVVSTEPDRPDVSPTKPGDEPSAKNGGTHARLNVLERQVSISNPEVNMVKPMSRAARFRHLFNAKSLSVSSNRTSVLPSIQDSNNDSIRRSADATPPTAGGKTHLFTPRLQRHRGSHCPPTEVPLASKARLRSLSGSRSPRNVRLRYGHEGGGRSVPSFVQVDGGTDAARRTSVVSYMMAPTRRFSRMVIDKITSTVQRNMSIMELANQEARVARTILIVVGCFVCCWVPFTVLYIIQIGGLCTIESGCFSKAVFGVCFWLGYWNSALNPIIYALFSRDLRRAFKSTIKKMDPSRRWRHSTVESDVRSSFGKSSRVLNNNGVGHHKPMHERVSRENGIADDAMCN